jgi:hypothetical protein
MGNPTKTGHSIPCSKSPAMIRRFITNNKGIAFEAGGGMCHWAGSEPVRALLGRASSNSAPNTLI